MTPTEIMLLAAHRSPVIPLESICEKQFGLSYTEARRQAALNHLPVAAFRLTDSQKAPLMVRLTGLATHIDGAADAAETSRLQSVV